MRDLLLIAGITLLFGATTAQNKQVMSLSIDDAMRYAVQNSMKAKTADLEILQADKDVWIQAAKGLPQVNGTVNFNNFIEIPTTVAPADAFGFPDYLTTFLGGVSQQTGVPLNAPPPDENGTTEFQFGQKYTMDAGVNVGLQLFDGSYIIGVKGAKGFQRLTRDKGKMTTNEIETETAEAYYTSQVAKENVRLLEENVRNMEKTLSETSELYKAGFAEEMDVEQLDLLMNGLRNKLRMAERQHAATLMLLKYQMGMPIRTPVVLTDDLETLWTRQPAEELLGLELDLQKNLAYDLVKQNIVMHGYLVKLEEAKYYPRLVAFFDYRQQAFRDEFNFFDTGRSWYPQTLWGIQLNVPIWDNLGAAASIKKAKFEQQKIKNELADLEQALLLQSITAKDNFTSSLEQLETSEQNIGLASRIREKTLIRYNEGLATSLELTTAENQLLTAQTEYISSLFSAMDAKMELKKILEND